MENDSCQRRSAFTIEHAQCTSSAYQHRQPLPFSEGNFFTNSPTSRKLVDQLERRTLNNAARSTRRVGANEGLRKWASARDFGLRVDTNSRTATPTIIEDPDISASLRAHLDLAILHFLTR